jgi:hypothetical protein
MADILHPEEAEQDEGSLEDQRAREQPLEVGDFVVAAAVADQFEAEILVQACGEAGIPALVTSPRSGLVGTMTSPVEAFLIQVPARDLSRARELLAERRAALESDPEGAARAAEDEAEKDLSL